MRDSATQACVVNCPTGQNLINGVCGTCALGTVFDSVLKQCVCPSGTYANNNGYCEPRVVPPIACTGATYASSTTTCSPCPAGCLGCTSATVCTACDSSLTLREGRCVAAKCGNGFIDAG